jgi:predicted DCC family thiol-disulfide oxidoreductase YuxK
MAIVIYDGDCAFCSSAARLAQKRIAPKLTYSPYQFTELAKYAITVQAAQSSLKFVAASGQVFSANFAVSQIMRSGNRFWNIVGVVVDLPIIRSLAALGYNLTAKYRHKLPGGTPTCKM